MPPIDYRLTITLPFGASVTSTVEGPGAISALPVSGSPISAGDSSTSTGRLLVFTSTRTGTNPYITGAPRGDDTSINPLTGESLIGAYQIEIADWPLGSMQRALTQYLNAANSGQPQMSYLPAVIDYQIDGGGYTGNVLKSGVIALLKLVDAMRWNITVKDPMAIPAISNIATQGSLMNMIDFLKAWPIRGCILGGPVTPDASQLDSQGHVVQPLQNLGVTDYGGWKMRVTAQSGNQYKLTPVIVYGPTAWPLSPSSVSTATHLDAIAPIINKALGPFQIAPNDGAADSWTTIQDCTVNGWQWTGITILISSTGGPDWSNWTPWKPLNAAFIINGGNDTGATPSDAPWIVSGAGGAQGIQVISDGTRTLTDGAIVYVRALTILPSEISPLYSDGHPIDPLLKVWNVLGLASNVSACNAMKALIGTDAQVTLRITDARAMSDIIKSICIPWGIGIRANGSGQMEPFDARLGRSNWTGVGSILITNGSNVVTGTGTFFTTTFTVGREIQINGETHAVIGIAADNSLTTDAVHPWGQTFSGSYVVVPVTIGANDVVQGSTKLTYELNPAQAINTITIGQKQYNVPYADDTTPPVDQIVEQDISEVFYNTDPTAVQWGTLDLTSDAMVQYSRAQGSTLALAGTILAQRIFNRWGHGAIAMETTFIRGGAGGTGSDDGPQLGDVVLIALPQIPNMNYRLGDNPSIAARAFQIVRRTILVTGYACRLVDAGPGLQPLATVPTLSIAASTDLPRTVAVVTVTDASTLNGLGYGLELQMALTLSGLPAASQFTDVLIFSPGQIPTGPIRLNAVLAGSSVFVQARSTQPASNLPSNFGTVESVTLSDVNDPSSLTAAPSGTDASLCVVGWTPGSGLVANDYTDIFLRASGQPFSAATKVATLANGSVQYVIQGLTASTAYIATVQHRNATSQDVSDPIDISFTSGSTVRTLASPNSPYGFAGSLDPVTGQPIQDGTYGIAALAAEYPGYFEVAAATETAQGSGSYGSFVTVATLIPDVQNDWTKATFVAPQDGLRRQLKARHVGLGSVNPSAYTAIVTVLPWTPLALPPSGAVMGGVQGTGSVDANGAQSFTINLAQGYQSFIWKLNTGTWGGGLTYPSVASTISGGTTVNGTGVQQIPSGSLPTLSFSQSGALTVVPFTGPNGTGTAGPEINLQTAYTSFSSTTKSVTVVPVWALDAVNSSAGAVLQSGTNALTGIPEFSAYGVCPVAPFWQWIAYAPIILPTGVTLTATRGQLFTTNALNEEVYLALYKTTTVGGTPVLLGNVSSSLSVSGWQVPQAILTSETITSTVNYALQLYQFVSGVAGDVVGIGSVTFTYTMPQPLASL